ncbi:MAG: lycopene cyclase domain-containing protein [Anaerolineae bacterium]|nr:lycopene cyclase domain-containing protein [Anaerolineae bacterium]
MTYFGVLLRFIGPPLVAMAALTLWDVRRQKDMPAHFRTWSPWAILFGHVALALIYTTPWDNYLVASRVWWYDPALVTGIVLGWVPIEEYTFFVVQTLMVGLWVLWWMRHLPPPRRPLRASIPLRLNATLALGLFWLIGLSMLLSGWGHGRYMALLLVWALPPILIQFGFGADILWHYRKWVLIGLLPSFLYLCLVDGLAIKSGTWTINPQNTLGLDLFGILPLEEIVFFLVTSTLISFGIVLMLARESHIRARTGKATPEGDPE